MARRQDDDNLDSVPSDKELVSKALRDSDAFTALYQRYMTRVYRYFLSHVSDAADAEDLTSQTFIAVLEGLKSFNGGSAFSTWLFGIANHKRLDHFRRQPPMDSLDNETEIALPDETESLDFELQFEEVLNAMKFIGEDRAQVIALRVFADLSVTETAAIMNKSEEAIYALMSRAVRDLRQLLVKGEANEQKR